MLNHMNSDQPAFFPTNSVPIDHQNEKYSFFKKKKKKKIKLNPDEFHSSSIFSHWFYP